MPDPLDLERVREYCAKTTAFCALSHAELNQFHATVITDLPAAVEEIDRLRADKARLDWLATHQTINYGLAVGGYWFKSDLRWQQTRIREAIDAARNEQERK